MGNSLKCPHCGQPITFSISSPATSRHDKPFESRHRSLPQLTAAVDQPGTYREKPQRLPNYESHVMVPKAQAIITGIFAAPVGGIIVGLVAYWGKVSMTGSILTGLVGAGLVFFCASAWQWFVAIEGYNQLLWQVEEILKADLDGDGQTGQPQKIVHTAEVRLGKRWLYEQLPHSKDNPGALVAFAQAVTNGQATLSERGATQTGYGADYFKRLRDEFLLPKGFAYKTYPDSQTSGISLNVAGRRLFQSIAGSQPATDTLPDETTIGMSSPYIERGTSRESWG